MTIDNMDIKDIAEDVRNLKEDKFDNFLANHELMRKLRRSAYKAATETHMQRMVK